MQKKVLMLSFYPQGLKKAWNQYGYQVIEDEDAILELRPEEMKRKITNIYEKEKIEYVFGLDFSPAIAEVCAKYNIVYVSWIVDSPRGTLWFEAAKYPINRIFSFDYLQWKELSEAGNTQIYYLPLATDVELLQSTIISDTSQKGLNYVKDVSFMAGLYDAAPHNYYDRIKYLPPYTKGYLDSLMEAQRHIWGINLVHTAIADNVWADLRRNIKLEMESDCDERIYACFIKDMIYKKITQLERKEVCSYLARHFDFALYSGSDTSYDEKIDNRGYVNYVTGMPLVFHYSKININITLHGISTGIPLRVLDILACGGFCLTNYQEEIATYFEDGVELVIYSDFADMYKKIEYYLEHEEERKAIAKAGYEKVKNQFDYIHGIGKIVSVLEGENE